jgi:tetratricopeptide (TPR) repeat protein
MKIKRAYRRIVTVSLLLGLICCCLHAGAQSDPLAEARRLAAAREYTQALTLYKKMYAETPRDEEVYRGYLNTLLATKRYKEAEKLVYEQLRANEHPFFYIDLGHVYQEAGKGKKATDQFDKALSAINGDDMVTQQIVRAFSEIGNDQYTILAYERAREILRNPWLYYNPLARLYAANGQMENAVNTLLDGGAGNMGGATDTKSTLLEILGDDPVKLQLAQKALVKRVNRQPDNIYYAELLTWLYTQKGDWDGALIQIRAIDERNRESGQRVLAFAQHALQESQYDISLKALEAIISKGSDQPLYGAAKAEQLRVHMRRLENDPTYASQGRIDSLSKDFSEFFAAFPQYNSSPLTFAYARLEAQFNNNVKKGIALLEEAIAQPAAGRQFVGEAKLQLGDYYLLAGKIWDASLTYSQVDKAFREDQLGEEARFRNAKLAYYRGDFSWAQAQLSVLKSATSELIANDALYLSVLITENITPDSNLVPLERFAYADLLLFRNKHEEAAALLDSMLEAFPGHPLNDDILLLHARISEKRGHYNKALAYLEQIYTHYGDDVLADDAVFKTALIFEKYLKEKERAISFYENLILNYPGSTYVQSARQKLAQLNEEAGKP